MNDPIPAHFKKLVDVMPAAMLETISTFVNAGGEAARIYLDGIRGSMLQQMPGREADVDAFIELLKKKVTNR